MFKEKARKKSDYDTNLCDLAQAIRSGEQATQTLLLGGSKTTYKHNPDHSACSYDPTNDSPAETEKRLCRCIYFLNGSKTEPKQQKKCAACSFPYSKYTLSGEYVIQDYEAAAPYNKHNGADLIWTAPDGETYAVEVKPADSTETILRMVAEILTYTLPADGFPTLGKPAVCFFKKTSKGELSAQWQEYLDQENNDDFKTILSRVHVFYFTLEGNKLTIHDAEKEPICK